MFVFEVEVQSVQYETKYRRGKMSRGRNVKLGFSLDRNVQCTFCQAVLSRQIVCPKVFDQSQREKLLAMKMIIHHFHNNPCRNTD